MRQRISEREEGWFKVDIIIHCTHEIQAQCHAHHTKAVVFKPMILVYTS